MDPKLRAAKLAAAIAAVTAILNKSLGPFERRMVSDAMIESITNDACNAWEITTLPPPPVTGVPSA